MSFSSMRGFNARMVFAWIRSEAAERYRPAPKAPMHDPWWQADMDYASAWAGAPVVVPS